MEKQSTPEAESLLQHEPPQRRRGLSSFPRSLIASALVAGLIVHYQHTLFPWLHDRGRLPLPLASDGSDFSWECLEPKPYLDYVPCTDGWTDEVYGCAKLQLPMDYWNGTTNANVSIAIMKKPAVVSVTHSQYGGPILLNPGGPGGSGVGFLAGYGDALREGLEGYDPENEKYFDLIGFDPRGVGLSTPIVNCFIDPVFDESLFLRMSEEGVFSSSDAVFGRMWAMYKVRSNLCSMQRDSEQDDIKQYVSTASVVRDMIEIIERHGEWRDKEAQRLMGACDSDTDIPESLRYRKGEEKINYIGFSYGTLLGNTFAAMYPDRINRLVVDGVVDAYDYTKSLWLDNLVDDVYEMELFYHHCARVGHPRCALANETGETTEEGVKKRTLDIIQSLYHHPIAVVDESYPDVITWSDVKELILGVLYSPLYGFPIMAELLVKLEQRDASDLAMWRLHDFNCYACFLDKPVPMFGDATMAIACGDGDDQTNVTKDEFKEHVDKLAEMSPLVGEVWANHRLGCIHYSVRPHHRFRGPWTGNTSHPILEIGNTADPVTPGRYAKKMAEGFEGAVALIQNSAGHCSLATPSNCTLSYVREYFQKGTLPPPDTVCEPDVQLFDPLPEEGDVVNAELVKSAKRASDFVNAMHASHGGFLRRPGRRAKTIEALAIGDVWAHRGGSGSCSQANE